MDAVLLVGKVPGFHEELGSTVKSAKTYESLKGMITFSIAITITAKKLNILFAFPIQQQKDLTKKLL